MYFNTPSIKQFGKFFLDYYYHKLFRTCDKCGWGSVLKTLDGKKAQVKCRRVNCYTSLKHYCQSWDKYGQKDNLTIITEWKQEDD